MIASKLGLMSVGMMIALLGVGVLTSAAGPGHSGVATGATLGGGGFHALYRGTTATTSYNWAGYDIKTKSGAVTDVKASWNVPQIAAACPRSDRFSSFWVGIDGDGSPTVEQIGTETDCSSGSAVYYAWYEFYPAYPVTLSMALSPANHMHGEVKFSTSTHKFTLSLSDLSTGKSFSITKSVSAKRASAEWIAEAPSNSVGVLPLTNFGWVVFNNASATISGATHSISGFSNNEITMWNSSNTTKMAIPLSLANAGATFRVNWNSAGP